MKKLLPLGVLAAFATLAACETVSPDAATMPELSDVHSAVSASNGVLRCPAMTTGTVTERIGPQGGTVELNGHSLVVPKNAVQGQVDFTIHVPATNELLVSVTAEGLAGYEFRHSAELTLSFAECAGVNERLDLRIVHLAEDGSVESYGGTVDWDARTVTADIDHLSDYAIGTNRSDYAIGTN